MEPKKPHLCYPVAVEGKYDKIKLESLFEGEFFVTNGFSFFKDEGKKALFRRLAEKTPIIVFTDSDSAGRLIRNHFKGILPADRLIHLYIPQVKGKEKRKSAPSKEGYLGVEGSDSALLRSIFAPYILKTEEYSARGGPFGKKGEPLKRTALRPGLRRRNGKQRKAEEAAAPLRTAGQSVHCGNAGGSEFALYQRRTGTVAGRAERAG